MSKPIRQADTRTIRFSDLLRPIPEHQLEGLKQGSSGKLRASLRAIMEEARREGQEEGFHQGYEDGFQRGLEEGKAEFERRHRAEFEKFRQALEAFVARTEGAVFEWTARAEDRLAGLAIEIARRALDQEMKLGRDAVLEITRAAMAEVRHGTKVRVRVNPLDVGLIEAHLDELVAVAKSVRNVEVVPDLRVEFGCEIETDGGVIDGQVESYLRRLDREAA